MQVWAAQYPTGEFWLLSQVCIDLIVGGSIPGSELGYGTHWCHQSRSKACSTSSPPSPCPSPKLNISDLAPAKRLWPSCQHIWPSHCHNALYDGFATEEHAFHPSYQRLELSQNCVGALNRTSYHSVLNGALLQTNISYY